jgi:hypothetical protein
MWVDYDVPNWFLTLKNFYRSHLSKSHIKFWWYWTMLNFCDIVAAILKRATSRNCSMSGLTSEHHYLPTYQIVMISDKNGHHNTAKIQHCPISSKFDMWVENDVLNWFPTLKNFYQLPFLKCWIFAILWWPFWKWRSVEIVQCQDSIRHIIIYPHIKLWWYRTMLIFCEGR